MQFYSLTIHFNPLYDVTSSGHTDKRLLANSWEETGQESGNSVQGLHAVGLSLFSFTWLNDVIMHISKTYSSSNQNDDWIKQENFREPSLI